MQISRQKNRIAFIFTQKLHTNGFEQRLVGFGINLIFELLARAANDAPNEGIVILNQALIKTHHNRVPELLRRIEAVTGQGALDYVADEERAPVVSLTDDGAKIVISRLGAQLRIAGTAELSGYSTHLNPVRCEALTRRVAEVFPGAAHYDRAVYWAGLRPSTPSNVPLVGRTRFENLYLNTGHGTLGWTMACGSGKAMSDILSARRPEVDFAFTR